MRYARVLFLFILLVFVVTSVAFVSAQNIPTEATVLFEYYLDEVWNKQNIEILPQILTPDVVHHDASIAKDIIGIEAVTEYVIFEHEILADVNFTAENLVVNSGTVTGYVTMRYGDFESSDTVAVTVVDGRLADIWFDVVTFIEAYNRDLFRRFWEVIDSNESLDDTALDAYLGRGYRWHNPIGTYTVNLPAKDIPHWFNHYHEACTEWAGERILMVEHNYVISQSVGTCLFNAPLMTPTMTFGASLFPTNERIDVETVWIWRIKDGQFVETWWYMDEPWLWAGAAQILTSPAPANDAAQMQAIFDASDIETQNMAIVQGILDEIWNAEEIDATAFEVYREQLRFGYNNNPKPIERNDFVALHLAIRKAFPDSHIQVRDTLVSANQIAINFAWTGTQSEIFEFDGITVPPTNEATTVTGWMMFKIVSNVDGTRVTQETWFVDFPFLAESQQIASR